MMNRVMNGLRAGLVTVALLVPMAARAGEATTTLVIDGMHCAVCAPAVTKALKQVDGVRAVDVSVSEKRAVVVADESVQSEMLIAAVAKAGFSATVAEEK
jgi:periplasmic mercuric ion binding protein